MKAAIAVYDRESEGDGKMSVRESRVSLKARLQSLEAQAVQQTETITKLRGELAAANERQARQASHFTGELRRLGPGAASAGNGRGRRGDIATRSSLADRVAQAQAKSGDLSDEVVQTTLENTPDVPSPDVALDTSDARADATATANATASSRTEAEPAPVPASTPSQPAATRPRLLDRIAGLSRSP